MQRKASRLKAMMVAFISISMAFALSAAFYYFKIQQNEKYQNQLHFRELNNITVSLENGISAFNQFIQQENTRISSIITHDNEELNNLSRRNFIAEFDTEKQTLLQLVHETEADSLKLEAMLDAQEIKPEGGSDVFSPSQEEDLLFKVNLAMNLQRAKATDFISEQVLKVNALASKWSELFDLESKGIAQYKEQSPLVETCLNQSLINMMDRYAVVNCFTNSYRKALHSVVTPIRNSLGVGGSQAGYSQNSPLRSITSSTSSDLGFAKLATDELTNPSDQKQSKKLWSVPITDWLSGSNDLYPLVLLVNSNGEQVARKQDSTLNSALVGIEFNDVTEFLDENSINKTDNKGMLRGPFQSTSRGVSKFLDVVISGNEYRLFISPFSHPSLLKMTNSASAECESSNIKGQAKTDCDIAFYVIGLREKAKFNSTKQTISRSIIAAAILFILALIAFVPLLKIRLSSVTQAFSAWDRHSLAVGCVLLITVLSVGLFDYTYYSKVKNEQSKLGNSLFIQIRNAFGLEVKTLIDMAYKNINPNIAKAEVFEDYLLDNKTQLPYFIENLFILNGRETLEESVKLDGIAMWGTEARYRGSNKKISLLSREYAVRGVQNQLWPVKINQNNDYCESGLFMERLFNLRDGGKSTQFALSCDTELNTQFNDSLSFGTQIQTFTNTIMPANFGFVVFDNKTGKALYHSEDDARSLVENVFVETDNSALLKAHMSMPYFYNQPTSFEVDYSGKVHNFTIGTLKQGVPWTLVVFYDKRNSRAINLMSVLVTLTICFVVFVLVYYFVIMIVPKSKRRGVFWPTPAENNQQKNITILSILIGAFVFFGGLTLIIANNVFEHHDLRYQQINNAQLGQQINTAKNNIERYRNQVLDNESVDTNSIGAVPCFLGTKKPSFKLEEVQTCSSTLTQKDLDIAATGPISYLKLLIESFWGFSVLEGDIDETLVITTKLNQTILNKVPDLGQIDNNLNLHSFERSRNAEKPLFEQTSQFSPNHFVYGVLIAVAFAAFSLVLFKITKEWIFERFFGFNIPPFFRLNEKTRYDVKQALLDDFFLENKYLTIVRPKLKTQQYLNAPASQTNNPFHKVLLSAPLINSGIIDLQSIFAEGETPEFVIDSLLAAAKLQSPNSENFTIALSGIENTAFSTVTRLFVLNAMEYLLAKANVNVILLCEVAPLYRLTQPELYPSKHESNEPSCASEMVRWSNILKQFIKVYDWSPNLKNRLRDDADASATLIQEAIAWPELRAVLKQFFIFNKATHPENHQAYDDLLLDIEAQEAANDSAFCQAQLQIDSALLDRANINNAWIPEQIVEFFQANSGALYRFKWEQCTKTERIILFQIASGLEPNPLNRGPLEHLVRRGYICRDKGWFLINTSFKEFVLNAESHDTIERWLAVANQSIWQYLRIPFFAIVIVLLAIMAYTATDAIETAIGVLSAVFALIPLAIKNFTAMKTGGT